LRVTPVLKAYMKITPPRAMAGGFVLIIWIGAFLLSLPIALAPGKHIAFIDALFMAVSATCVTGLTLFDVSDQFSVFGQIVILIMVQLGGLGFMTMATWFAIVLKKRISLQERLILKESLNQLTMEGIIALIVKVFIYSVTIELAAALFFVAHWADELPLGWAIYYGIFHSVSIFNNAGFELIGEFRSLTTFVNDVPMNIVTMLLVLLGGIGFIVMSDLLEYHKTRRLSLHSKVVLTMTGVLTLLGAVMIYIFEYTNTMTLAPLSWDSKICAAFFQSVTLRSAGVNTIDIAGMRDATQFLMIIMMFIGAAPGSTGGGIKITTFALLIGALLAMVRGKEDVVIFRHRMEMNSIHKAITLTLIGVFLVSGMTMFLCATQGSDFLMVLFETTSAFGTVGLSMGLTTSLTFSGKIGIIIMMFIGRIGLVTLAIALQANPKKDLFRYPEGKITIG
jgi:trk system potassium uptake protein TrkH